MVRFHKKQTTFSVINDPFDLRLKPRGNSPLIVRSQSSLSQWTGHHVVRTNEKGKGRAGQEGGSLSHEFVIESIIFRISTTRLIISSPISSATRLPNLFIRIETILNLLPQLRVKPSQVSIQVSDHPFHFWHFLSCLSLNCISPQYSFSSIESGTSVSFYMQQNAAKKAEKQKEHETKVGTYKNNMFKGAF